MNLTENQEMVDMPSACCVVPCYNVSANCREVIAGTAYVADQVIAINDGSTDETDEILRDAAAEYKNKVRVLSFAKNRGKGVALLTGFRYAIEKLAFDVLVTIDGDGQYDPLEIPRFIRMIRDENADFVIGQRIPESAAMPLCRRVWNRVFSTRLRTRYPFSPFDTQCGFRAIKRSFAKEIISIVRGGRYETEFHILMLALERKKSILTLPVETVHDRKTPSHFRPFADGFLIHRALHNFSSLLFSVSREDLGEQ